ncbi:uncharacterized protein LOC141901933 isoform X2 [Tubulanus polymorphus]
MSKKEAEAAGACGGSLPHPGTSDGPWRLGYLDFWPVMLKKGGTFSFPEYEPFGPCIQRCNDYLMANPHLEVITVESVETKIRYGAGVNPEIMAYMDYTNAMSFVRGLRLWIRPRQEPGPPQQLAHINVMPGLLKKGGVFSEAVFENLSTVVDNVNKMFRDKPLPGRILTIETQDMKMNHGLFSSNHTINPDQSAWVECPGHIFLFVLRIFYIVGPPAMEEIGFSDSLPTCLKEGSWTKLPHFTPVHQTVLQAQDWIKKYQSSVRITNVQAIEHKVNYGMNFTASTAFDPSKMSYWNRQLTVFVRGIRVAYVKAMEGYSIPPSVRPIVLTERVFYPVQLTNCKTFQLPTFETLSQTMHRANEWLKHVDANVVGVETIAIRIMARAYGMGPEYIGADASFSVGEGGKKRGGCIMQIVLRIYLDNYYTEPPPHLLPPVPEGIQHWTSVSAQACTLL